MTSTISESDGGSALEGSQSAAIAIKLTGSHGLYSARGLRARALDSQRQIGREILEVVSTYARISA